MGQIDENVTAVVREVVLGMIERIGIEAKFAVKIVEMNEEEGLEITLDSEEASVLIGQAGVNLMALEHLTRLMTRRKLGRPINLSLDVNEYRLRRQRFVQEMAEEALKKVTRNGEEVVLKPMLASERRMVHTYLAAKSGVITESTGEDPERQVVVKPV